MENGETEEDNGGTRGIKGGREERGLRTAGRKATEWLRKIWGLCWKRSGQKYKQEIKHKRQKESGR